MTDPMITAAMRRVYDNFEGRLIVPHQTEAVRWLLRREFSDEKSGVYADDMGLGKTACMLATCLGNPVGSPTIIVVPKSLVKQWATECTLFTGLKPLVIHTAKVRKTLARDVARAPFVITTYEALKVQDPNPLLEVHYGRMIMDEAHAVKNTKSIKSRSVHKVNADIKWCVTGTPITRRKRDLLALMESVGVKSNDYEMLRQNFVLRRTFEDAARACERLRLPDLKMNLHIVPFETREEKDFYIGLTDEATTRIKAYAEGIRSEDNTAHHITEVIMRLRQGTVNPKLVCEGRGEPVWTGSVTRVNELVKLVSQQPEKAKTIIFTHWNTEALEIKAALETRLGLNAVRLCGSMSQNARDAAVSSFTNDSTVDVLISHIDVGGVGLNLQAATHVYINSLHWNPANELQAIARAHRLGVTHVVHATRLAIRGTIDEFILNMHDQKLGFAADVLKDQRIRKKLDAPGMRDLQKISHFLEHGYEQNNANAVELCSDSDSEMLTDDE
jgi:SNF2 family DNA or RNA helicase